MNKLSPLRQTDDAIPPSKSSRSHREADFYSSWTDDRVRCRDCGHWCGKISVSNRYIIDGNEEREWYDVRTCSLRHGHEPDGLRRCDYFIPKEL